jgi:cytochrome c-type biogenesis protein CcmF
LSGDSYPRAFGQLVARNRRRYGGYIVHAAIVLLAIGVAGSNAYDSVIDNQRLAVGDSMAVAGYTLTLRSTGEREAANATEIRAVLDVRRGDKHLGTIRAGKNAYAVEQQVSNEVGIRSDLLRGEDLFVIAGKFNDDGSVIFRVFVKPLVNLIWLAGLVFLLGALIAMWPDAREQRRLATRYAPVQSSDPSIVP